MEFQAINFNEGVINIKGGKGRHQMFNSSDAVTQLIGNFVQRRVGNAIITR